MYSEIICEIINEKISSCLTITRSDLTNTPVIQRLPQLFNDYNGIEVHEPYKTRKTPPQNCSAAGFAYALK